MLESTQKNIEAVKEKVEHLENTMQITANKEQSLADRLNQVSHNANEVKDVLGIIRDIADQTNLLALNAAIEAARAKAGMDEGLPLLPMKYESLLSVRKKPCRN